MQNARIVELLRKSKPEMAQDGFLILGLFDSMARGDNLDGSDANILYEKDMAASGRL